MYYFGYYLQFGCPCTVKWTGDVGDKTGPGVGGSIHTIIQVHVVNREEFRRPLSLLAAMYPFKELPPLL